MESKLTALNSKIESELPKLDISPQVFDEMLTEYSAFVDEYKSFAETNHTAFYILSLAVMYNAGLKGGAV